MKAGEWRKLSLSIGATVGLLAVVWLVGTALAQGPEGAVTAEGDVSVTDMVAGKINYQGRLTDPDGVPLHGTFTMQFEIYGSSTGWPLVWASGPMSVDVDHGLFNVDLSITPSYVMGSELWLQICVNGEWLSPRQELVPVPYALSLRPGARIVGPPTASDGWVLTVQMDGYHPLAHGVSASAATGSAIHGESTTGHGALGSSTDNHGVSGLSENKCGVYGSSTNSHGVYGRSVDREGGFFVSENERGVYGKSEGDREGVLGESIGGDGVHGTSTTAPGVSGYSSTSYGVHGHSENTYAGYFTSEDYRGLYAMSESGWADAYFGGTYGIIVESTIYGHDDLSVWGDITAGGSKTGYVVDIALNDGPDSLELGDVVVITGVAEPILGEIPVPTVRKASETSSTGVMGVVDRRFVTSSEGVRAQETEAESPGYFEDSSVSMAEGGGIAPGEYVGVVTLGSFEAIKVDASYGAIQPGDLLVSSDTPGHAMKAQDAKVGTVIGKALGSLDSGTGVIPVLITLQ
jgi:hypothetical protein